MSLLFMIFDLFRHMEWAGALIWRAVLPSEIARASNSLRAKLHHVHQVQHGFLAIWQGRFEHSTQEELIEWSKEGGNLRGAELMAWGKSYHGEAQRYLAGLNEAGMARAVVLPWADMAATSQGKIFVAPNLAETIFQVVMHSAHHRGQINAGLRDMGVDPPLVDFIAWAWSGKPAAQWLEC
jgi:uncharacterized damage-inducible protein DinB